MLKKILLGILIGVLVLAVLGGVAAVSFGVGMRQGFGQVRLVVPTTPNANGQQVTPPLGRGRVLPGQPNRGNNNNPRQFVQPFNRLPFAIQPNVMTLRRSSPFGLLGGLFGLVVGGLVITVLVLVVIRLLRPGHFGPGPNRMMFFKGGPDGMPAEPPPFFAEWHQKAHGPHAEPPDEAKAP